MSGRYKAIPETTTQRALVYVVIDTLTGEWKHVYDCFLWAEKKAEEMNATSQRAAAFVLDDRFEKLKEEWESDCD